MLIANGADVLSFSKWNDWRPYVAAGIAAVLAWAYSYLNPADARYGVARTHRAVAPPTRESARRAELHGALGVSGGGVLGEPAGDRAVVVVAVRGDLHIGVQAVEAGDVVSGIW